MRSGGYHSPLRWNLAWLGVSAKLGVCVGIGKDVFSAESGTVAGGGDDGLTFVGIHEAGGFEDVRLFKLSVDGSDQLRLRKHLRGGAKEPDGDERPRGWLSWGQLELVNGRTIGA